MLPDETAKCLMLSLLCVVTTAVNAAPTMTGSDNDFVVHASSATPYTHTLFISAAEIGQTNEACNPHLPSIAAELLKPTTGLIDSAAPVHASSLPPVPGALFMALVGFLCVSLVRDRKVWTAALVGLLWAGQVGLTALPQLARHLAGRRHTEQLYSLNLTGHLAPDDLDRLRSDIEGTTYVGLLHYLAGIPDNRMSFLPRIWVRDKLQQKCNTRYAIRDTSEAPQHAITEALAYIVPATRRLVRIAKRHGYFSPAFIFDNLARGPPLSAWECRFIL